MESHPAEKIRDFMKCVVTAGPTYEELDEVRRMTNFFTATADLRGRLAALASPGIGAVFHVAAVSDFTFGKIWERAAAGELREIKAAKIPTRPEGLLAELKPTPKII